MDNKSTLLVLTLIIGTMGAFVVVNGISNFSGFIEYMGFRGARTGTALSWALALLTVALYCYSAASIADVRNHMFRLDGLKAVAIVAAVCAGIVEEVVFRKWVMDYLESQGFSILSQLAASALSFGVFHLLWGLRNHRAGVNAALSTALLGLALAIVYWLGDRSLAPCIVAHFCVTALIQPGMLIAAQNDRLGYWRARNY
ncbi:MAG: CPBP family intramembrane glutamic endopeptidase [Pseudomonadota bacterium]